MKDTTMLHKGLLIAGGLLGLGILGFLLFREKEEQIEDAEFTVVEEPKPKSKPIQKETTEPQTVIKTKNPVIKPEITVTKPDDAFPLRLGSKGERIRQLQVYLLRNHGGAGIVTDEFDTITEERVKRLLRVNSIDEKLFNQLKTKDPKSFKSNGTKTKH